MKKTILFLCTGNYYRSRYAEAFFNHVAPGHGLDDFVAVSRGLAIGLGGMNHGAVSIHTREITTRRGIVLDERMPQSLTDDDLRSSHLVIAVKEAEHRPMLDRSFSGWSSRVVFWNVHDIDAAVPEVALAEIEGHVTTLIAQLQTT